MTSVTYHDVRFLEPAKTRNYLNVDYGAWSWLLTRDHKRIGILYMVSISIMFILGGFFAMMMRLELLTPDGDLLTSRSEEHTSELQSLTNLVCRLLLEKK